MTLLYYDDYYYNIIIIIMIIIVIIIIIVILKRVMSANWSQTAVIVLSSTKLYKSVILSITISR